MILLVPKHTDSPNKNLSDFCNRRIKSLEFLSFNIVRFFPVKVTIQQLHKLRVMTLKGVCYVKHADKLVDILLSFQMGRQLPRAFKACTGDNKLHEIT